MEVTYDAKAKAMYIKLNDRKVAYTKQPGEFVALDFDADNQLIGIELTYVPGQVDNPFEVIYRYTSPDAVVDLAAIPHRKTADSSLD